MCVTNGLATGLNERVALDVVARKARTHTGKRKTRSARLDCMQKSYHVSVSTPLLAQTHGFIAVQR